MHKRQLHDLFGSEKKEENCWIIQQQQLHSITNSSRWPKTCS